MPANVLFLVIDSLRSDKIFGSEKTAKTPILDNLIENGLFFPNNIASADGTMMSWAGMLTSLEPLKTGVKSEKNYRIDSKIPNNFSIMKKEGYHIFGCVPKFAKTFGMMQNFENEDTTYENFLSLYDGLGEKILSQLKAISNSEPWIYFVHINDIHFPVIPPKSHDEQKFGESKYDRTISSIDEWLGRILDKVDLEKTLVVITADHGAYVPSVKIGEQWVNYETDGNKQKLATKMGNKVPSFLEPVKTKLFFQVENYRKKIKEKKSEDFSLTPYQKRSLFSQRGDLDHFLFDERIKVPLIFTGNGIENNKIVSSQVRTLDIFPTLFDILNIKSSSNSDGRSLIPQIKSESIDELPALIVSSPLIEVISNDVIGIRTSKYKYFRDKDNPKNRVYLFDLKNDPLEEKNIAEDNLKIVNEMEKIVTDKLTESKSVNPEYSEDELKNIENELKKMGYI